MLNNDPETLQDFLTSSYLLTSKDRFYTRADLGRMLAFAGDALLNAHLPPPAVVKPLELWTGKQVFSMLIRPNAQTRCVHIFHMLPCCPASRSPAVLDRPEWATG